MQDEPDDRVPHPGPHHHCEDATRLQRAGAWVLNFIVIGAWIGIVTVARLVLSADLAAPTDAVGAKAFGHGLGLLTLTVPVLLYFALPEWRWGYSLGKAALGLRVVDMTGHYPSLPRALLRNAILLAPWELAHIAIWWSPTSLFLDAPTQLTIGLVSASAGIALVWIVSTLLWPGRSIHDWLSGTKVVQVGVLKPEA